MTRFMEDIYAQPQALQTALEHVEGPGRNAIRDAAAQIRLARRIVITSMGSALFSAHPLATSLARHYPSVQFVETSDLLTYDLNVPGTVTIIISRSGESGEVKEYVSRPRNEESCVIAVTMSPASTLANLADIVIEVPVLFDGFICTRAYTSLMLACLCLREEVTGATITQRELWQMPEIFERALPRIQREIEAISWIKDTRFAYFLGEGFSRGTAQMGALLFEEGARRPAASYSARMFQHGPIEAVEADTAIIWIDLEPTNASERLYDKVAHLSQRVLPFCTDPERCEGTIAIPGQDYPVAFRPIFAAAAIQLLAHCAGQARGHTPGEMRYLDWIVR